MNQDTRRVLDATKNGKLWLLVDELDHEENQPVTAGLHLAEYPAEEPLVVPLDCLADAVGRLIDTSTDHKAGRQATAMLAITREHDAVRRNERQVIGEVITLLEARLQQRVDAARDLIATIDGNTYGLTDVEQLTAIRTAAEPLKQALAHEG